MGLSRKKKLAMLERAYAEAERHVGQGYPTHPAYEKGKAHGVRQTLLWVLDPDVMDPPYEPEDTE